MTYSTRDDTQAISRGIIRAFRILTSFSLGLAASLGVVVVAANGLPIRFVLALLAGLGGTLLYRVLVRLVRTRISKPFSAVLSVLCFAAILYAIWYYKPGMAIAPTDYQKYSYTVLLILLGYWLAGNVLSGDPESLLFDKLRGLWAAMKAMLITNVPAIDALVFACAVLLSLYLNVPTPHLGIQAGLTASSAIATLSLGWYAHIVASVQEKTRA